MLQTATLTKKKSLRQCIKNLLLIRQGKIRALSQHTQAEVAIKIKTGPEKFLCGKLADHNGRGG